MDVALAIRLLGRVGAIRSELWVLSNHERETLTVGDVPMEGVDLDPTHGVERSQHVRDRETRQRDATSTPQLNEKDTGYALVSRSIELESTVDLQVGGVSKDTTKASTRT